MMIIKNAKEIMHYSNKWKNNHAQSDYNKDKDDDFDNCNNDDDYGDDDSDYDNDDDNHDSDNQCIAHHLLHRFQAAYK